MATDNDSGPTRIDSVSVSDLRTAAENGKYDPGVDKLIDEELKYIRKKRENATRNDLAGLALSGGGIRSATFALGVMQALAKEGVLSRMDYLSTVSGGGYIGSALTWLLGPQNKNGEFGLDGGNFPWGIDSGGDSTPTQAKMLNWLRQHGSYLTPGKGITLASGISIVLRGILLNLIVWIPIGIAVFWALLLGTDVLGDSFDGLWSPGIAGMSQDGRSLVPAMLAIAGFFGLLYAVYCVAYSLMTAKRKKRAGAWRYHMRRLFERTARWPLLIILAMLVLTSLPLADAALEGWMNNAGGPLAAALGLLTGLWNFLRTSGSKERPLPPLVPIAGAALIVYGIALISFQLAVDLPDNPFEIPWWFPAALFLSIASGIIVNINYISIHRFYRDRLMETFLADVDKALKGETGAAIEANSKTIQSTIEGEHSHGPYHIVNTNIVLVAAKERRWKLRGGDSFILTPKRCGSSATGWVASDRFLGGGLSLATAMSISGAAANPNSGAGGVGLTRSRSVSLLMALLNLRLGYWVRNPRYGSGWLCPNHFLPGLIQAFGLHREESRYIELSDGGHFDNLALYELIRRRPKLIILCDGAADPKFGFADLNTLQRRIAADFEARIEFEEGHEPDRLIPKRLKELAPDGAGYAVDADMAERAFVLGRIEYALTPAEREKKANGGKYHRETGVLVYLKTTMVKDLPFGVKAYKGAHHDFPDQTTADQFFDEEQFDAYRELGRHLGLKMLEQTELTDKIEQIIENGAWPAEEGGTTPPPS